MLVGFVELNDLFLVQKTLLMLLNLIGVEILQVMLLRYLEVHHRHLHCRLRRHNFVGMQNMKYCIFCRGELL